MNSLQRGKVEPILILMYNATTQTCITTYFQPDIY